MKKGKGIVLEVTRDAVILLGKDGSFIRRPHPHPLPLLGEEIEYELEEEKIIEKRPASFFGRRTPLSAHPLRRVALVAMPLILILTGVFLFFPMQPEAAYVVALDINPNLELYVDAHDRVQRVRTYSAETVPFLAGLQLTGMEIERAIREITEKAKKEGYLNSNSAPMVATVIPLKDPNQKEEIVQKIEKALRPTTLSQDVILTSTDKKSLEEAHQENLPVYKYAVLRFLEEKGSKVTEEKKKEPTHRLIEEYHLKVEDLLSSGKILRHEPMNQETAPSKQEEKSPSSSKAPNEGKNEMKEKGQGEKQEKDQEKEQEKGEKQGNLPIELGRLQNVILNQVIEEQPSREGRKTPQQEKESEPKEKEQEKEDKDQEKKDKDQKKGKEKNEKEKGKEDGREERAYGR